MVTFTHQWVDITPHGAGSGVKEYRCTRCGAPHFTHEGGEPPPEGGCPVGPQVDARQAEHHKVFIRAKLDAISDLYTEIEEVLSQYAGEGEGQWLTVGGGFWECEKSPVGICVYHRIYDRPHDSCIFCHEPEERK